MSENQSSNKKTPHWLLVIVVTAVVDQVVQASIEHHEALLTAVKTDFAYVEWEHVWASLASNIWVVLLSIALTIVVASLIFSMRATKRIEARQLKRLADESYASIRIRVRQHHRKQ